MEIDVTHMVDDDDEMPMLSGSQMELGRDAGKITWTNSLKYGQERPLLKTDDERDAARAHFSEYGAWSDEEIDAWSEEELQAMVCQEAANAIRERERYDSDEEFLADEDHNSGRLYRGDDGRWYLYLGM
jgi:hypothetical protein